MFRFPNPGSNIERLVDIFRDTFADYTKSYSLDYVSYIMAQHKSASAVGSFGIEAFIKSQTKDKSRNSIYGQAKAYAETYRWLGWVYAENLSKMYVTPIGRLILDKEYNWFPIFKTCFLCWVTPNENIKSKSEYNGYPILNILNTAVKTDGKLSRDEMIVGPLNEKYERLGSSAAYIDDIRKGKLDINDELTQFGVSKNTLGNYTRIVIAGLRFTKLMEKSGHYFLLTNEGKRIANKVIIDKVLKKNASNDEIISSFKRFLEYSQFVIPKYTKNLNDQIFGSPYQVFKPAKINSLLVNIRILPNDLINNSNEISETQVKDSINSKYVQEPLTSFVMESEIRNTYTVHDKDEFTEFLKSTKLSEILEIVGKYKKEEFYPFVGKLFRVIGFEANLSPNGQNAQRADIVLSYQDERTIPVEVKSKTEVSKINIKSIEQAFENKIILRSRQYGHFKKDDASFVVGFSYPSSASKADQLVKAYYKVYGVKIVLISIRTLVKMAKETLEHNRQWDIDDFITNMGEVQIDG